MKLISVWSRKGGASKTTLALNLAGLASSKGLKVLLIDDDPQGSSTWLAERGRLPFEVMSSWPNERPTEFDVVFVDYPPRTDDTPAGDTVIIPYRPTALDFSAVSSFITKLSETKKVIEVVTQLDRRLKEPMEFAIDKKSKGAHWMVNRSVYQRAASEATTVFDPNFSNISGSREARTELEIIFREAMNE
ncbi:ParA family protein [Shewanella sairae]|nr:ParA family protein [Shewanella sairae]MCL1132494.1 ParA family protein [Shewanella sairae]